MKTRILPLLAAIIVGLLAVLAVNRYVEQNTSANEPVDQQRILFASSAIQRGEVISEKSLEVRNVPQKYVTEGMVQAGDREHLEGHRASVDIAAGQPMFWTATDTHSGSGFAASISPNQRAVTITFGGRGGAPELLRPGDRVDVISTYPIHEESRQLATRMLMQDIPVLAVDARTELGAALVDSLDGRSAARVTLQVNPREALLLALAEQETRLELAIRNPQDVIQSRLETVTMETIRGGAAEPEAEPVLAGDEIAAPVPGYPVIIEQGRNAGSAFFSSPETVDQSVLPGLQESGTTIVPNSNDP